MIGNTNFEDQLVILTKILTGRPVLQNMIIIDITNCFRISLLIILWKFVFSPVI